MTTMTALLHTVRSFDGVLELAPEIGSEYPEISWGDHFFYYAPDGVLPERTQPYATIVTKDYPDDAASELDGPGRWRVNIHVGADAAARLLAEGAPADPAAADVVQPHPLYGDLGWIAIVNPGPRTEALVEELLHDAHEAARRRRERRHSAAS